MLNSAEHAQLSWAWKSFNCWYFYFYDQVKFHAQLSWAWKKCYSLRAWSDATESGSALFAIYLQVVN